MTSEAAGEFQFRDVFNADVVEYLATRISDAAAEHGTEFDADDFRGRVLATLSNRSFGDRNNLIIQALDDTLAGDFPTRAAVVVSSLGPEPAGEDLSGTDGFYVMPLAGFIARNGLMAHHLETSLAALYELTKRFTVEGDIRPFITAYPERTLAFLRDLTADPSPFARRLASEGTRPRLPLAGRLPQFQTDPTPVIDLLDRLYNDPNLMVRRSVANNINDIAKDNPDVAVATLARWQAADAGPQTAWVVRHGLRTLIKREHPEALSLLGFRPPEVEVLTAAWEPDRLTLGESGTFTVTLRSTTSKPQRLSLNYTIGFVRTNGTRSRKVFRLRDKTLIPGEPLSITKTHVFRDYRNQSFYSGVHTLEVTTNGVVLFTTAFTLEVP